VDEWKDAGEKINFYFALVVVRKEKMLTFATLFGRNGGRQNEKLGWGQRFLTGSE